nr:hypothetical protein [Tanacetum cinerariifolium]
VFTSSRFAEMPVTSYKRKARKAPDVSVRCSHHDDVCSYQFRPRSSDNKKSVRVSALYLRRKRNLLLERPQLTSESYRSYFNFHLITVLNPQTSKIEGEGIRMNAHAWSSDCAH